MVIALAALHYFTQPFLKITSHGILCLIFYPAMARYAIAKNDYVEADLQRNCAWNKMYKQLIEYKEKNGDVLVLTSKDSSTEIKKLAKWVQNQRVHYKYHMNGDTKHIKAHRIDALNQVRHE